MRAGLGLEQLDKQRSGVLGVWGLGVSHCDFSFVILVEHSAQERELWV